MSCRSLDNEQDKTVTAVFLSSVKHRIYPVNTSLPAYQCTHVVMAKVRSPRQGTDGLAVPVPLQTKSLLARAPPCSNQLNWEKGKVALEEGSAQKQQLRRGSDQTPYPHPFSFTSILICVCNFRPPPSRDSPALVTTTLINFVSESSSARFPSHHLASARLPRFLLPPYRGLKRISRHPNNSNQSPSRRN